MIKPTPQLVGYLKGEPVYSLEDMPPTGAHYAPHQNDPKPQPKPITLPKLFQDLRAPIENFERYFEFLRHRLDALSRQELEMGIPASPSSPERNRLHQQIALVSTALTYLRSLWTSSQIMFAEWNH